MSEIHPSFAEIDGHRLEVLQSTGLGPCVFLFHGNSGAAHSFEALLRSPLGRCHRLIACSFPGHGTSSKVLSDKQCAVPALGRLAARFIASFGVDSYWLVGHSLGAHALYQALDGFEGALGLVALSAPPLNLSTLSQAFQPDPCGGAIYRGALEAGEVQAMAEAFTQVAGNVPKLAAWIQGTAPRFREALGASLGRGELLDEVAALRQRRFPAALFVGEADRFIQLDYCEQQAADTACALELVRFPNAGHAVHLDAPARFESELAAFMARAESRAHAPESA
jgi:pimeloyl-ACP methyl ester carboxylesterase